MALGVGPGKRVNDGVALILVLGFEPLQPSRLPSHGRNRDPDCGSIGLRLIRAEPAALFPLHPLSASPARVGLTLLFSTAPGCRPVLETDSRLGGSLGDV